jgi:hypothetical protein
MARAGARVVVDEVFLGGAYWQRRWRDALGGLTVLWVGVRCDAAVDAGREVVAGHRPHLVRRTTPPWWPVPPVGSALVDRRAVTDRRTHDPATVPTGCRTSADPIAPRTNFPRRAGQPEAAPTQFT